MESLCMVLAQNYLRFPADEFVFGNHAVLNEIRRWKAIISSCTQFDVVHYNFGSSLAPMRIDVSRPTATSTWKKRLFNVYAGLFELADLRIASRIGRVIAVTYQGDDARQGDYCRANFDIHFVSEVEEGYYSRATDCIKRERIDCVAKYADLIYAVNPDLLHVLPERASFIPYAHVDLAERRPSSPATGNHRLHLIHAPSHRAVKGTRYLLEAVNRLHAEGIDFQFTLVEGVANQEAWKIYQSADLLVDQLLAGFYGGLAVELMALGKPVICYLRESDMAYLPQAMWSEMPIINANPQTIYTVLKEWLTVRRQELKPLGTAARAFVEKWHDPLKIAACLIDDYQEAWRRKSGCIH